MTEFDWGQSRKDVNTILEGDFPVIVTEATAGESQNGKEQIKIKLRITSGQYAGRTLFDSITISPESQIAMRMFFQSMDAFGLGDPFFARLPKDKKAGTAQIAASIQGKEVMGVLTKEPYQQIDRQKVKGYKPNGTAGVAVAGLPAPVVLAAPVAAPVLVAPSTAPPVFAGDAEAEPEPAF